MKGRLEFGFYLSVSVGMALSCSSFLMLAGLFEVTTLFWVLVALVLGGLFCTVLALSIGELAAMYPSAPAIVTYFRVAFGQRTSLVFVYLYLVFIVLISGVESYLFAFIAATLMQPLPPLVAVVVLLVCVVVANLVGLELPRGLQIVLTAAAVAVVLVTGLAGAMAAPEGSTAAALHVGPVVDGLAVLPAAVGLAVFLYMGFEWVTPLGLRQTAYLRMIPAAMPVAVATLAVAYGAFSVGIAATLPRGEISGQLAPQMAFFGSLLGQPGLFLAGLLSLCAIFSTFNAGVMGASKLIFVLARNGSLPAWCASVRASTGGPVGAVLLLGGLSLASAFLVVGLGLQLLATVVGAAIVCVIYAGYVASVLRLRRVQAARPRPFRTPVPTGGQWLVLAALVVIALASLFSLPGRSGQAATGLLGSAVIAVGLSAWSVRRTSRIQRHHATALAPERGSR